SCDIFLLSAYRPHRILHSFPTRRSSDLQLGCEVYLVPFWVMTERQQRLKPGKKNVHKISHITGPLRHLTKFGDREYIANCNRFKDRKSTRLNSSHSQISYAVFCLKKKKK